MASASPLGMVFGGMVEAAAIDAEANMTAEALNEQAYVARANAANAREAGQYNAARQQEEAVRVMGTAAADVSASGTTQDSGSVMDIFRQSTVNAEMDRQAILHGAELDAISYENEAAAYDKQIKSTFKMATYRKVGALIGGASRAINASPGGGGGGGGRSSRGGGGGGGGGTRRTGTSQYISSEGY